MSVEYSAQVICGFKIEEKEIITNETRYNHLTGEPYEIEIKSKKFFIGDFEMEGFDKDCEEFQKLKVISSGDDSCDLFLGEVVAATDEHYSTYDEFLINISVKIRKFGVETGVSPSFFLILNWS